MAVTCVHQFTKEIREDHFQRKLKKMSIITTQKEDILEQIKKGIIYNND